MPYLVEVYQHFGRIHLHLTSSISRIRQETKQPAGRKQTEATKLQGGELEEVQGETGNQILKPV
jgi:hypothetical protein